MTLLATWSIAWVIGIWLSSLLAVSPAAWGGAALAALLAATLVRSYEPRRLITCAAVFALGATRFTLAEPRFDQHSLATYNDRGEVTLVGVVADAPDVRDDRIYYRLDARSLETVTGELVAVHGTLRLHAPRYPAYAPGDRLRVHGDLDTPPVLDDFNYRDFLSAQGIYSQMRGTEIERLAGGEGAGWPQALFGFKDRAGETIGRALPEPEASLLTGILLGTEGGIPRDTLQAFSVTGTSHVIAISGFNISIVIGLLMATLGTIARDRRLAAGIAMVGVVLYTALVGAGDSVVRAAIMGIVTLIGLAANRKALAYNSLAAAVLLMTLLNPRSLWSVGFQLSVAATLGLIVYADLFQERIYGLLTRWFSGERARRIAGWAGAALLLTVAAQIMTTPLTLKYFAQLSLVSLLANALVLPVQPLVMICGGLATLAGMVFEPLGQVLGWAAYLWLTWTARVVEWTAAFPHAAVPFKLSDAGLVAVYAIIALLTALLAWPAEKRNRILERLRVHLSLKAAMSGMALTAAVAWAAILQFPDQKLHVAFLDVGQGDAIFIETPAGVRMLIDGGPSGGALLSALGRQMPFWARRLDLVILTHPDDDHLSGLVSALQRYQVGAVIAGDHSREDNLGRAWENALQEEDAQLIRGVAGTHIESSDGVVLDVLHPGAQGISVEDDNTNDLSVVVRLTYQDVAFLLPGDIGAEIERQLVKSGEYLYSTVLKVPHHGSAASSCAAFLAAVRAQVAVISVGMDNRFEHPAPEVLERLAGTQIYRTDLNGTVTVTTDGHTLWIQTGR